MSHGKQHYCNDDQILHCHFVTQPLDKNQWDQQWDTFLWATFITLRSITVVGESEDVISLLQNFPKVPLTAHSKSASVVLHQLNVSPWQENALLSI